MKWVLRIFLLLILLGAAAGGYFYYSNLPEEPDPRLACYYGAYEGQKHELVFVTPTSGREALRAVLMNGSTWRLEPVAGQIGTPTAFKGSIGWSDKVDEALVTKFGSCAEGTLTMQGDMAPIVSHHIAFDVRDTTFVSHGVKLFGRLTMPKSQGPVPVAVLVHGSERDSAVLFNRLQYIFAANGIGVFAYDKRGTGKSDGSYTQDFDLLADDAATGLNTARTMAGDRAGAVGFQGGSQAGWIEPLAAMKTKADFVLVGFGLAVSPIQEDYDCVVVNLHDAGFGDKEIAKAREITDATAIVIASHFTKGFDQLEAVKAKYGNEPWYKAVKGQYTGLMLAYPSIMLKWVAPYFEVGTPYAYDSMPPLQVYNGPQLWVLAGDDSLAPSAQTLAVLRRLQVDKPKLSVVVFPKADHGILDFERKNGERVDTGFANGYFDLLVEWIKTRKVNVPADSAVVYRASADNTPPSGNAVMDEP